MNDDLSSMHVLIVIPIFKEQGKIGLVINKIPVQLHSDVLVVDDCSSDNPHSAP
jgi:glycosyltransferase involved in cell wall biosynthesis